jgi:hypothetical protein
VPRPDPSVADEATNTYVFDKAVTFPLPDGKTTTKYIDLYRKGAFACETKQSVERPEKDPLSVADPAAPKARRKSGTSVRGTAGWDDSMIAARGQAENYVRGLADDNSPFLLVIDIGHFRRPICSKSSCSSVAWPGRRCRPSANNSATWAINCFFQAVTWLVWMPNWLASWAVVRSPMAAAKATLALNGAPYTRRLPGIVILLIGGLQARKLHLIRAPEIRGPPQCSTRRPGCHGWRRLLTDVELQAHRKCGFAASPV